MFQYPPAPCSGLKYDVAPDSSWNDRQSSLPSFSSSFSRPFSPSPSLQSRTSGHQAHQQTAETRLTDADDLGPRLPSHVSAVGLLNSDLWLQFCGHVNEMTVNKIGRRMFPFMQVDFRNLDPKTMYSVFLDFPLDDQFVWKFGRLGWSCKKMVEDAHRQKPPSYVEHPASPNTGEFWCRRKDGVNFKLVKFSNDDQCQLRPNCVFLRSYHRYLPRVNVVQMDRATGQPRWETLLRQTFPETSFIAVCAYMNPRISELKIFHNPYARAFKTESVAFSATCPDSTLSSPDDCHPPVFRPDKDASSPPVPAKRSQSPPATSYLQVDQPYPLFRFVESWVPPAKRPKSQQSLQTDSLLSDSCDSSSSFSDGSSGSSSCSDSSPE